MHNKQVIALKEVGFFTVVCHFYWYVAEETLWRTVWGVEVACDGGMIYDINLFRVIEDKVQNVKADIQGMMTTVVLISHRYDLFRGNNDL